MNLTPAGEHVRKVILNACKTDDVELSVKAQRYMATVGVSRRVVLEALISQVENGFKVFVKQYDQSSANKSGYHGSLLLDPDDDETVYFEVKLRDSRLCVERVWLQVKEHSPGLKLPR